ncbi:thioredoxin peroxidase [Moniliophthora roreri MCA 2997]|uniref:Thioredoxin peroxidase n=2 Tax=Moniliophthora roreri TaxID=221103 RepID=V2X9D3_MONRO|nr:thioredoxin peroxidase [Moniliophthora roreri MCA 2997]KAI3615112.1 thioredoxin peroxidase [Moniliophthora roreri]
MTSLIASAAQTAHSAVANLLSVAQVKPGATVSLVSVKEEAPDKTIQPTLEGKNVFLFVPGAYSGTCSGQVPKYIAKYQEFVAKGIKNVYVVAVNDAFVMKAWKAQLAPEGTGVRFLADDKGELTSSLGLLFDATAFFGAPRAKRSVVITDGDKVESIAVEPVPSEVTVTDVDKILALLS